MKVYSMRLRTSDNRLLVAFFTRATWADGRLPQIGERFTLADETYQVESVAEWSEIAESDIEQARRTR